MAFEDFNPTKGYKAGTYIWNAKILYQFVEDHPAGKWAYDHVRQVDRKELVNMLGINPGDLADLAEAIEAYPEYKRYGVTGIEQSASALTRIYDAVGMRADVGNDTDNDGYVNDFDSALPWMWRKCVGTWNKVGNRAVFTVAAYLGDEDYTEDGSIGDYVAVEVPRSYYSYDGNKLVVSAHQYEGYRAFDIFCIGHNQNKTLDKIYLPAYAMGLDADGAGASMPGLDNDSGSYYSLVTNARKYKNGALGTLAILEPAALQFYLWAMFVTEFAQQNCEQVMKGCISLRHNNSDTCVFTDDDHVLVNNWNAGRVEGEYIVIAPTTVDMNTAGVTATHRIVSVTRCDSSGTASASGTYTLVEIEDLGTDAYEYDKTGETTYRSFARPYRSGSCNALTTPSGYIEANDGYHPFRYRYIENIYGNQYTTVMDLFNKKEGTGDDDWTLDHYLLLDPTQYTPSAAGKPDAAELATDLFVKLGVVTDHDHYKDGYIVSMVRDEVYQDIRIPWKTTGGSATTYYADYASSVYSSAVRARRCRGAWYYGQISGPSLVNQYYAPSYSYAYYGGCLCFAQG